jgi:hypothetical protein
MRSLAYLAPDSGRRFSGAGAPKVELELLGTAEIDCDPSNEWCSRLSPLERHSV